MAALRLAAGLEAIPTATQRMTGIAPSPFGSVPRKSAKGGTITAASSKDDGNSFAGKNRGGKCADTKGGSSVDDRGDEHPPDREGGGNADPERPDLAASGQTESVNNQSPVGAPDGGSCPAAVVLCAKPGDSSLRAGNAAAVVSSMATRGRREEARRRAELHKVCT